MKPIYTEDQIREAWVKAFGGVHMPTFPSWSADALVARLKKDNHMHDWADTDTITVAELRTAYNTVEGGFGDLLRWISEHRDPTLRVDSVWRDDRGIIWQRTTARKWLRVGFAGTWDDQTPKRPLHEMAEVPF